MDAKDILTIEDYKKRISDLIDELEKEIEDLEKAVWYINDRIKQLKGL